MERMFSLNSASEPWGGTQRVPFATDCHRSGEEPDCLSVSWCGIGTFCQRSLGCNPTPGSELFADEAQVVGRFEVGNPVVEETDAMRLAKAIQLVEPDRPLAQPLSEVLEEELEPTWRVQLDDACRLGPRVPHGVWDPARFQHPAAGCCLDDLIADPSVHLPLEHVEPDIVHVHVWQ